MYVYIYIYIYICIYIYIYTRYDAFGADGEMAGGCISRLRSEVEIRLKM